VGSEGNFSCVGGVTMAMTDEQKEALDDFNLSIKVAAQTVYTCFEEDPAGPKFYAAVGVLNERVRRREAYCSRNYKLEVW
jgi:hypothetical protein